MNTDNLIRMLQVSISPVVLISGVGLLLLSMTNRLGRVVDRARVLAKEARAADARDQKKIRRQLRLLHHRARILRVSIFGASISILLVAVIILALFADFLVQLPLNSIISLLFIGSVASLVFSMVTFLHDLTLSLRALWMEISDQV